jgi:hypothetical protein
MLKRARRREEVWPPTPKKVSRDFCSFVRVSFHGGERSIGSNQGVDVGSAMLAGSADLEQVPLREVDTENEDLWERKLARARLTEILLASLPS